MFLFEIEVVDMKLQSSIVQAVASIDLAVTDITESRRFFKEIWRLDVVDEKQGRVYFRASGPQYYVLSLRQAEKAGIVRVILDARNHASVDIAYKKAVAGGYTVDGKPRALTTPGGGYGFGVVDPEGRNYCLVHDMKRHEEHGPVHDHPTKITHINLNSVDNDASFRFTSAVFDFKLSDQTRIFRFLSCNSDHHSLGLAFSDNTCLNHIAFEVPDMESVMLGIGRMRDNGYPIEWGPGRHGAGNNVFAYFCGPDDLPIEYTAEVLQVDDSYQIRKPHEWGFPPGRVDQWGVSPGPSERVKRAQSSLHFIQGGHQLD